MKAIRGCSTFVIALVTCLAVYPQQDPKALDLLRRMLRAEMTQSLAGTRITIVNTAGRSERVAEVVLRSGPNSRVEFPKDSPRHGEVVVEYARLRQHYVPAENTIYVGEAKRHVRLTDRLPRIMNAVRENKLSLTTKGSSTVAGRKCTQLVLTRNDGAPVWTLHVDEETSVLLKQQVFDPANPNRVIGGFEYTQVNFNVQPTREDFVIRKPGAKVVRDDFMPLEEVQKRVTFRLLQPDPPHANLTFVGAKVVQLGGKTGAHLLYHDTHGLEPLSVFQVQGRFSRNVPWIHRSRDLRVATRQVGDITLTAMGRMSEERLRAFLQTFK